MNGESAESPVPAISEKTNADSAMDNNAFFIAVRLDFDYKCT